MGSLKPRFLGDGFISEDDDGTEESFTINLIDGFKGNKGSRIERHVFDDGYTVIHPDGTKESFRPKIFGFGYVGDKGTQVDERPLGYKVTKKK